MNTMADQQQQPSPNLLSRTIDVTGEGNFPQGCSFSPDGLCVLTSTAADNRLRLYNTPPLPAATASAAASIVCDDGGDGGEEEEDDGESNAISKSTENQQHTDTSNIDVNAASQSSHSEPNVNQWTTALHAKAGDSIRSYAWYPRMNSSDPTTCAFLAASRDQPIHLIDAYTSAIRASYLPYNGLDEMEAPNIVTFSPDGTRIFAGGFRTDRMIHVFHTEMPGRDCDVLRLGKSRRSSDGQKGMVSAIAFPQYHLHDVQGGGFHGGNNPAVFAVGCYSPGSIYIYDDRMSHTGDPAGTILNGGICAVGHGKSFSRRKRRFAAMSANDDDSSNYDEEEDIFSAAKVKWYQSRARGGITQLTWSPTGEHILYSASRRSDAVVAWDVRVLSGDESRPIRGLASYARDSDTNQRMEFTFDDDGQYMFVSSQDRSVKIYDVQSGKMASTITGLSDAVNGVSYKSTISWGSKGGLLAVAVGARRFGSFEDDDELVAKKHDPVTPGSLEVYQVPQ